MIAVTGIGYIDRHCFSMLNAAMRRDYENIKEIYQYMKDNAILTGPIKNFGRFDYESKRVCLTAGLSLHDAKIFNDSATDDIGIVMSNKDGSLFANCDYFKDYIACGRTLGRGNLFIYTLPTSPLAETAICYHLNGPLLYTSRVDNCAALALEQAKSIVEYNEANAMLAIAGTQNDLVCFVVEKARNRDTSRLTDIKDLIQSLNGDNDMVLSKVL